MRGLKTTWCKGGIGTNVKTVGKSVVRHRSVTCFTVIQVQCTAFGNVKVLNIGNLANSNGNIEVIIYHF